MINSTLTPEEQNELFDLSLKKASSWHTFSAHETEQYQRLWERASEVLRRRMENVQCYFYLSTDG